MVKDNNNFKGGFELGGTNYNGLVEFEYQPDIITNRDRLHRLFTENIHYVNVGFTTWALPLSFVLTLFLTLITSEPIDKWGIDASIWKIVLLILFLLSSIWFLITVVILICKNKSINEMIDIIEDDQTGKVIRDGL